MSLTSKQQEVLDHLDGHLLVLAGPGSGKTHTLIEKIFHIFDQQIIAEPYGLLAVTYSNAAVTEINTRLWTKSFRQWDRLSVQTFHSFANYLLRCYGSDVGVREDFKILEKDDRAQLLQNLIEKHSSPMPPSVFRDYIEGFKRQGIYPDCEERFQQPGEKRFLVAYKDYQGHLFKCNQLDFDDLIYFAIKLLNESELASALFTNYFRYIIVDEFQDTDSQQLKLIELLARTAIGSTVVADDDQAIYGFRGGDRNNVQTIKDRLDAELITLPENFRSPATIARAAQFLVRKEADRADKHVVTMSDEEGTIYRLEFGDDQSEAEFVAGEVLNLCARHSVDDLGQIAIISRNRFRASKTQGELDKRGISWFDRSRLPFTDSWEANIALAIVDMYCDLNSSNKLFNLMNAIQNSGIAYQWNDQDPIEISCKIRENLRCSSDIGACGASAVTIVEESGFNTMLQQISSNRGDSGRLINNVADVAICIDDEAQKRNFTLSDIINVISGRNAVQLLTGHGSKGKEFDCVFFIGVEDDVIPGWGNLLDEKVSEERRVFYVAITRTRKELLISYAKKVGTYANKKPSRFLNDIPQQYFSYLSDRLQNLL